MVMDTERNRDKPLIEHLNTSDDLLGLLETS